MPDDLIKAINDLIQRIEADFQRGGFVRFDTIKAVHTVKVEMFKAKKEKTNG